MPASIYSDMGHIKTMAHTPGSALSVDDIVLVNGRVCVAYADIASGVEGQLITGADDAEFPILGSDVVTEGDDLYWDDGNSRLTLTATANTLCARAREAKANGPVVIRVELRN